MLDTILKGVLLVLASYLQVLDLYVTKAHLVNHNFLMLLKRELEVCCGLKTRDVIGVMLVVIPFNSVVPRVFTTVFDCLCGVCKEATKPALRQYHRERNVCCYSARL